MAYGGITVTADPTTLAEANTAFTSMNVYVSNLYSDMQALLATLREHVRLRQGNPLLLQQIDSLGGTIGTPGNTNPTVVTDPVTLADADATLAVHIGYLNTFITRCGGAFQFILSALNLGGINEQNRAALDAALVTFSVATGAVTTAGSDPVSAAHMNAALAAAITRVDTLNARFAPIIDLILERFRLKGGNLLSMAAIQQSANAIRAH